MSHWQRKSNFTFLSSFLFARDEQASKQAAKHCSCLLSMLVFLLLFYFLVLSACFSRQTIKMKTIFFPNSSKSKSERRAQRMDVIFLCCVCFLLPPHLSYSFYDSESFAQKKANSLKLKLTKLGAFLKLCHSIQLGVPFSLAFFLSAHAAIIRHPIFCSLSEFHSVSHSQC